MTLELGLAEVPTVVAYKVGLVEREIARRLISVTSASLPNLILGRKLLPEFIDGHWTSQDLADSVAALVDDGAARDAQLAGFAELSAVMAEGVTTPSATAAAIVLGAIPNAPAH